MFLEERKREGKTLQDRKRKSRCPRGSYRRGHEKEPEPEPEENITYENVAIPEIHIHRKKNKISEVTGRSGENPSPDGFRKFQIDSAFAHVHFDIEIGKIRMQREAERRLQKPQAWPWRCRFYCVSPAGGSVAGVAGDDPCAGNRKLRLYNTGAGGPVRNSRAGSGSRKNSSFRSSSEAPTVMIFRLLQGL